MHQSFPATVGGLRETHLFPFCNGPFFFANTTFHLTSRKFAQQPTFNLLGLLETTPVITHREEAEKP